MTGSKVNEAYDKAKKCLDQLLSNDQIPFYGYVEIMLQLDVMKREVYGEWLYPDADCITGKQRIGKRWKVCSNCKKGYQNNLPWDAIYCPNCGSKNGGKKNE